MRNKYKGEDIRQRLSGTVIRYKGIPYLCEADTTGSLALFSLEGNEHIARVEADDDNIDISSLTLGFVNVDKDFKAAVYLKREPLRQYRQGIDLARLTQVVLRPGGGPINHKYLQCKGLVDSVLGRYPTLPIAISMITKNGWHSVAVSRDVAIRRDGELFKIFVKDNEVGFMRPGTLVVKVPETETSYYAKFFLMEIPGWDVQEGNK